MIVRAKRDIGVVKKGDEFNVQDKEEGLILISAGWFERKDFEVAIKAISFFIQKTTS